MLCKSDALGNLLLAGTGLESRLLVLVGGGGLGLGVVWLTVVVWF